MFRRTLIALPPAAAFAAALPKAVTAQTGGPAPASPAPGGAVVARRRVGRFEVVFLSDGYIDAPYALFTGVDPADLERTAGALRFGRASGVRLGFTQWLIRDGARNLLVDAGPAGTVSPHTGRLPAALAAVGLRPEQVDAIVLTHMHVDHAAGLVAGGRRVFLNAEVFVHRRDLAHFTDPAKAAGAPDLLRSSFATAVEVARLYPRLERVDREGEIGRGVSLVDLSGHTPGQMGVRIEDNGESLLLAADMLFHPSVHPAQSGIGIQFEADRPAADAARARFFARMAAEGTLVAATHMPFPGVGRVIRDGERLAWLPADWDYAA